MKDDDNYIPPKTVEQLHRHKYEHCHGQQLDSPSASMDAEIKGQPSDLDDSNEEDFEMLWSELFIISKDYFITGRANAIFFCAVGLR